MKSELSALLDGEMEQHQSRALFSALKSDGTLRDAWADYQLIGDALRAEPGLDCDITSRVMSSLADEPVILAPARRRQASWRGSALALAASAAGVAVVGWLALAPQLAPRELPVLARADLPAPTIVTVAAQQGMQEYLMAHQTNAPGLHMQGGTQHIRTVSATGER
jgi:sigma-E factor negative regulatory protein RseA